jgi:hypothetical protein
MQFLYPGFLWALLALAIPIIIHLFYFRRFKKVYFTNVRFLKEIKEETSNRNKLKNLLILLSRCLALAALVFAFAQPILKTESTLKQGLNNVSVFIDNSYSMTSKKDEIALIDIAKEKARSIISAYSEDDKFQILTHDFEGRHQRWISKEDALSYIDEIVASPSVQTLDKVVNKQNQLYSTTSGNKLSYIISDFQKSISNLGTVKDTTAEISLIPVQTSQNKNLSIDSIWFDGPLPVVNQSNNLIVRIKNHSDADAEQVKISFKKDGQDKPIGVLDIPANASITDTVVVSVTKSGPQKGIVNITDYPVQFDDDYFLSFNVPDTIHVLSINEGTPNKYISALIRGINYFDITNQNVGALQYQKFGQFDLIIINEIKTLSSGLVSELSNYIRNGGNVLVFPSRTSDIASYNSFMSSVGGQAFLKGNSTKKEVSLVNRDDFVFKDVYLNSRNSNLKLPATSYSFDIGTAAAVSEEKLLTYRDGTSYISKYRIQDGLLFVSAAPIDVASNDLVLNAEIFVPMVYKMAISRVKQKPVSYTIANKINITTDNSAKAGDAVYRMKGETEFIPTQIPQGKKLNLQVNGNIKKAGFYDLLLGKDVVDQFAFNYNRLESDLSVYNEKDLTSLNPTNTKIKIIEASKQGDLTTAVAEKDKGIAIWKWLLMAALLFLLIEILLIRFFK